MILHHRSLCLLFFRSVSASILHLPQAPGRFQPHPQLAATPVTDHLPSSFPEVAPLFLPFHQHILACICPGCAARCCVLRRSLVAAGLALWLCTGFSLRRLLLLQSTGSGLSGFSSYSSSCNTWAWDSLGKNTRMGFHSLLQGIFLTQESNLDLWPCRQILYCLSHREACLER